MIYPLLPAFLTGTLRAGPAFLGVVEGLAEAVAAALKIVSGRLSDRRPRRKPLVVGGYALSSLVRPLVPSPPSPATCSWCASSTALERACAAPRATPSWRTWSRPAAARPGLRFPARHGPRRGDGGPAPRLRRALRDERPARCVRPGRDPGCPRDGDPRPGGAGGPPQGGAPRRGPAGLERLPARTRARALPWRPRPLHLSATPRTPSCFSGRRRAGVALALVPALWALHHLVKAGTSTWGGALSDRVGRRRAILAGWSVYAIAYAGFALGELAAPGRGPLCVLRPLPRSHRGRGARARGRPRRRGHPGTRLRPLPRRDRGGASPGQPPHRAALAMVRRALGPGPRARRSRAWPAWGCSPACPKPPGPSGRRAAPPPGGEPAS